MADFRFPLSQLNNGKRSSTHTSVNPFALTLTTNNGSLIYDGSEGKSIDLTGLTVAAAGQLVNSRTIAISGAVTGTATAFNGTANITIATTALNVDKANAGTLAIGRGGTGKTSWTAYGIVYASAANTLGQLGVGTSGQVLSSKESAAPVWIDQSSITAGSAGQLTNVRTLIVDLTSTTSASFNGTANATIGISNNLPVSHGGTGKASWTAYGLIYASASTTLAQIGTGSNGQILKSQGDSKAPTWVDQSSLAVGSAAQFISSKTISLTGDVTGSASSVGGWSIATTIGAGKVTNAMLAGSIENGKLTNHSITVGTQTINLGGSINLGTLVKDLGMGKAFRYLGTVNAVPTSGTVNGQTCSSGDMVVVVGASNASLDGVYAYDGSSWSKVTASGAYKVLQDTVSNPSSSGTAYQFINTIAQDTNGVITATRAGLPFASSAQNVGTTASAGSANTVSRGDHVHAIALATGDSNGQVKIAGTNVSVKGLGSAAYHNITNNNEGYSSSAVLIPRIGTDGVMEVGKYIDFHAATGTSKDYDVRITAATTGLTISGTTSGTFSGSLAGNASTATAIKTAGTTAQFYRGDNTWSNEIVGGLLKITNNGNTVTIGSDNNSWCHFTNSANIPFYFNKDIGLSGTLGTSSYPANALYIGPKNSRSIYYVGTKATNAMITFLDNTGDTYGNGIKIGGGGTVVVGAGESAANLSVSAGTETLYLLSDDVINIEAGGDTIANRIGFQITTAGHIIPVKAEAANSNKQNLGASNNVWANVYATTFTGNLTGNVTGSSGSCTGNAATATKLATARTINGTNFDGSANITTANWGTARNISISDSTSTNTGTAVSVNGSAAVTLKLPATIKASLTGNAATATKLATARNIQTNLASTAAVSFDGSANVTPGVTGTLPVGNGGTGVATEALIRATYGIEYIAGTQTAATNAWIGVTSSAALYTGKTIAYYLPYAGTSSAATLNLTLSDGSTTGAKNVRINNSNVTTHFPAGTVILLVYDGTYWKVDNYDSNTNTNTLLRVYSSTTNLNVPLIGQSSANNTTAAWTSYTNTYKDWYGAIPNDDTLRAKINLSTGHITAPGGITANITGNITGSSGSCTGNAATATTATNLAAKPSLAASSNKITVTAGGKTSDAFTVPYATSATTVTGTAGTSTLSWNTEVTLATVGGNAIKAKLPANPNTNTTYTFAEGSTNGAFTVTPSGGSAQTVNIHGLGSAAYTASTAYAASGHTHSISLTADGTDPVNLAQNTVYTLTAGGQSVAFKTPVSTDTKVTVGANITTNANYPVVLAYSNTSTTAAETNSLNKSGAKLYFNPSSGQLTATTVANAVWNDYAEMRKTNSEVKFGQCVIDNDDGSLSIANARLLPGAQVVSDTWGHVMGETENAKTPVAVAGRVLVYPYRDRSEYHAGQAVCTAPNGTIDIMSREEIMKYPDCIIGIVSEIPDYETWGTGNVQVNGRIWIKIK